VLSSKSNGQNFRQIESRLHIIIFSTSCQYHIVRTPKYRFRILSGPVAEEVGRCIRAFSEQLKCEVVELNVQIDHVHLLVMIPPKIAVSDYVGTVKGRTAIRVFNRFRHLKRKPYWGKHF
jgi:putative transposase